MGDATPKRRTPRRARCCMCIGALALLVALGGYLGLRHLLKNWGGPGDGHSVWEPPTGSYTGEGGAQGGGARRRGCLTRSLSPRQACT